MPQLPDVDEDKRYVPGMDGSDDRPEDEPDASDEMEVTENEDGSATVSLPEKAGAKDSAFYANMAETLDRSTLNSMSIDLLDKLEHDKESRKERDEQYEEGLRRTGLGDDAPGGADFQGASKVVHPVLAEGCVDFAASSIKELFPPQGPVKTKLVTGKQDFKQLERAKKKRDYLNWLLTDEIEEYRPEKEILLTQLPLGGSQYEKYWYDQDQEKYCMEFVPIDKVILPFAAKSFYQTPRMAQILELTEDEFNSRVESGMYRKLDNITTEEMPEQSAAEQANDKIEGRDPTIYNDDGLRVLYEVQVMLKVEEDKYSKGRLAPYVMTIDEATQQCAALYRNWKEDDQKFRRLDWWVEDKFIPWRGVSGIGLIQLIGSMSAAITGSLRALLDSAMINNAPAMLKLKQGRMSGQNVTVDPTGVTEVDAGVIDDVRKLAMPMPYNPPSPVLYQLMDFLVTHAKGVVATAEEKLGDASSNLPVGTTLALIEQGSKVFSSIHARLHFSQARSLRIICRLIHDYPIQEHLDRFGLTVEDFAENSDISPVSDPNIFSEAQRYAQWQAVMQMAQDPTVQYNKVALHRQGLELLRYPDPDSILPAPQEPVTADPVSENQAALTGAPLKADRNQDHLAHLHEHVRVLLDPMIGAGPLFSGQQLNGILQHCAQHVEMLYGLEVFNEASQLGVQSAMSGIEPGSISPDQVAAMAAKVSFDKRMGQGGYGQALMQQLQQAAQLVQKKMPPSPMDPTQATLQAAMAETKRRADKDKADVEYNAKKLDTEQKTLKAEADRWAAEFKRDAEALRQELQQSAQKANDARQAIDDNFLIQMTKLNQTTQQLLADNQARDEEIGQRLGAVEQTVSKPPPEPPKQPDLTPHLQALAEAQDRTHAGLQALHQGIQALHQQSQQRPNKVVRDPKTGDIVGMTYDPNLGAQQ